MYNFGNGYLNVYCNFYFLIIIMKGWVGELVFEFFKYRGFMI